MMNVYENIAYGLRCAGASKDVIRTKVHDVLERISLPDVANREITQLSGGQKQRIADCPLHGAGPGCAAA